MTRQQLIDLFSNAIKNYSTNIYPPALVADWLDEGQLDIVLRTECYTEDKTLVSVANQREYALGTDVMKILAISYDSKEIQPASKEQMQYYVSYPNDTTTGTPTHYYLKMSTDTKIGFTPIPDTSNLSIALYYLKRPPSLVTDSNNPVIPEQYHRLIVKYAMYNVLIKDVKTDTLNQWKSEYERGVERMAEGIRNFDKKLLRSMKPYGTEHQQKVMKSYTRQ